MKKINNKRVGQTAGACTDSRPRAQCYQLGRLPLVGSSAFFLNAIVLSLSHGEVPSHRRSAFPSISQTLTRNANRKIGTPVKVNSPTIKCPMVRPQRYRRDALCYPKRDTGHAGVCCCTWLFVLRKRLNRGSRSFFRFISDIKSKALKRGNII